MKNFIVTLILIFCISCTNLSYYDEHTYVIEEIDLIEHKILSSSTTFLNIPSHQETWTYNYHVTKQGYPFDFEVTLLEPNQFCPGDTIIYINEYNIRKK